MKLFDFFELDKACFAFKCEDAIFENPGAKVYRRDTCMSRAAERYTTGDHVVSRAAEMTVDTAIRKKKHANAEVQRSIFLDLSFRFCICESVVYPMRIILP